MTSLTCSNHHPYEQQVYGGLLLTCVGRLIVIRGAHSSRFVFVTIKFVVPLIHNFHICSSSCCNRSPLRESIVSSSADDQISS